MSRTARAILGAAMLAWIQGGAWAQGDPPPALLPEPEEIRIDKNRFISFSFPDAPEGTQWAVRVKLVELYNTDPDHPGLEACQTVGALDFSAFEGQVRWVDAPQVYRNVPGLQFWFIGAQLTCCPMFLDWNSAAAQMWIQDCRGGWFCRGIDGGWCSFGSNLCAEDSDCNPEPVLYAYGASILPCSKYEVQLVADSCPDLNDESCFSPPLTLRTARWGDVTPRTGGSHQPDFIDIGYIVQAFRGLVCFVKVQAMLRGEVPPVDDPISFVDLGYCVNAFKQFGYNIGEPQECSESCQ